MSIIRRVICFVLAVLLLSFSVAVYASGTDKITQQDMADVPVPFQTITSGRVNSSIITTQLTAYTPNKPNAQ